MDLPTPSSTLMGDLASFRNYLQAERGLAENTVLAYRRDLEHFAGSVGGQRRAQRFSATPPSAN